MLKSFSKPMAKGEKRILIDPPGSALPMAEWLSCSARTTKVMYSSLDATSHEMTLDKSLTAVCLGSITPRTHTNYV